MKQLALKKLLFLTMVTGSFLTAEAAPRLCTLRVHATGLRNQKGVVGASVFHSPDGWPEDNDKAFIQDAVSISGDNATISFKVPPGKYAIVMLHDENMDHKLDRNFLGIPIEGFGFANNPHVFMTAPSFDKANVTVSCPETDVRIGMIYK